MKSWKIAHKFDSDFVDFMEEMVKKYPNEVFAIQGIADHNLDIATFSKSFFGKSSNVAYVSVDANANVQEKNVSQYSYENNKALMKFNSLSLLFKYIKKYFGLSHSRRVAEKVLNGELFVNDFTNFAMPYCYSFDLTKMITDGLDFFTGNMKIKAPKRVDSFISLFIQATAYISNQIMGASAYPNFFLILDWFYRKEYGEDYLQDKEHSRLIENQFQNIIYSLNWPFRGGQSPFTNLSVLDRGFLAKLFEGYVFPDLSSPNFETTLSLSKWFFEYYTKINSTEGIFTFPVMTLALSLDKQGNPLDQETVDWAAQANAEKGLANIFQDTPNRFSSCCRMLSDVDKVAEVSSEGYQNSFGVSGVSIGSLRVAGLNLARAGIYATHDGYENRLDENLEDTYMILYAHRKLIEMRVNDGFLPLYTKGWIDMSKQYSTFGFVGAYEYLKNQGLDIKTEEGRNSLLKVMTKMNDKILEKQKLLSDNNEFFMFNVEQIPAESMAVRLAELDYELGFNNTPENTMKYEMYSNQYIPLIEESNIYDRFLIQGYFDSQTTGGAILHVNVNGEKSITPFQLSKIMEMARKTRTAYFALNYAFSESSQGVISIGKHEVCPVNGDPIVKTYTRVVGFLTPTSSWNKTRKEWEYERRYFYENENIA